LVYAEIVEGKTKLLVPEGSLRAAAPPTAPVFFNPAASVNRDVSVAMAAAAGAATFCDSLAGVGARGVRIAKEVEGTRAVTLVDFNPLALKLAKKAARMNWVSRKCAFEVSEANAALASRYGRDERFESVDVDPFGTPARFLQGALAATANGGILSVTATDTAALCGVYPKVAWRRYGAVPVNNHFHHETGIRILVNAISRRAAAMEAGVSPVAAHATRHYVRVYARVEAGARKADESLASEGYVNWCPACGSTEASRERAERCPRCGARGKSAGPLWVGRLTESRTVEEAAGFAEGMKFAAAAKILWSLVGVDAFPPWSYSIEGICSTLKVATVPESAVRERLAKAGYRSFRQPFEGTGIKTDAPYSAVREAVAESRPTAPPRHPSQ
jgi:tRNA (guanine26-N2/guanine27-N2)-dimethyltransferase